MVWLNILQALWFIFPAYVANASPVIIRGVKPLDFGRRLNRHRILGDGKTIEGTLGGVAFGVFAGALQIFLFDRAPASLGLQLHTIELIIALSAGAILGDIVAAFIKRRLGIERGKPAVLLDQLDFLVVALLFASVLTPITWRMALLLVVVTPLFHLATNAIAYFVKLKKYPW